LNKLRLKFRTSRLKTQKVLFVDFGAFSGEMLAPRRATSKSSPILSILSCPLNSSSIFLRPPPVVVVCSRFASRWTPGYPPPRPRPPTHQIPEALPDPKDLIPGWTEVKAKLLAKAKNPDEVDVINELSPDEAVIFLDPETVHRRIEKYTTSTRAIPVSIHYFGGNPVHEKRLQDVEMLYEKYRHLPRAPPDAWPIRDWSGAGALTNLDTTVGSHDSQSVKGDIRRSIIFIGRELNKIHHVLLPPELKKWLDNLAPVKKDGSDGIRQQRMLDRFERSKGNGKRKTARAKVQIVPGDGKVYVNGVVPTEFFKRLKDVENVIWPLQALGVASKFNVWVSTWGGGTTGMFPFPREQC
jgi:Ribosomal protein S9/S16